MGDADPDSSYNYIDRQRYRHRDTIQMFTGAEDNIEKLCPKVVQCCSRAKSPRATLNNFGALFFNADRR